MRSVRQAWFTSLKTRITGFVLLTLFAALVGGISAASIVAAASMRRTAEERLQSTAGDLGSRVNHWIGGIRSTIQVVAGTPDLVSMDAARQRPVMLQTQRIYPEMYLVMTTDGKGKNIARNDNVKPKDYGDREYVKGPLAGSAFAHQSLIGKTSGNPAVAFGVPIKAADGAPLGVFAVVSETTAIAATVGTSRIGNTGLAYLVDNSNKVIAHPEAKYTKKLADFSADKAVSFMRGQNKGLLRYSTELDPRTGQKIKSTDYIAYVQELDGGWGIVVTQQEQEAFAEVKRFVRVATLAAALALLVLGVLIFKVIGRALGPVEKLTLASARLAEGHLDERVQIDREDEIGQLGVSFNQMAEAIQANVRKLAEHQEMLEDTVRQRTAELSVRNDEMRLVLDTVDQGLAVIERDGLLGAERSARFVNWFGANGDEQRLDQVLASKDEDLAAMLRLSWDTVIEDVLPLELALEQMPRRVTLGDCEYALGYRPIMQGDSLRSVLLIVTDITSELKRQRSEVEQREVLAVFERVMRDRNGFVEYFNDAASLVTRMSSGEPRPLAEVLRDVHTLKGNSAICGVTSVAEVCHSLETTVADEGPEVLAAQVELLTTAWQSFSARVVPLMGTEPDGLVEVPAADLDAIAAEVRAGAPSGTLLRLLEGLRRERIEVRLSRAAEQARGLAQRLGKGDLNCVLDGGGVRLPPETWPGFWSSLVHLLRNSVDHGIESPDERLAAGKSPQGTLSFTARQQGDRIILELKDDGRGLNFDRIREKAKALLLPHATDAQLVEALFADGLTTKDATTSVSGRGVGMSAVREACRAYGGVISVQSKPNQGTTFRLSFPKPADPSELEELHILGRPSLSPSLLPRRV